ncbi:hypothetical protein T492DRAFT_1013158 [Pavlovales sp. CCMP2436]|nr:hypothetical protein T492DRAFT_1013158 [Pavlovales sp. CCMP2436]
MAPARTRQRWRQWRRMRAVRQPVHVRGALRRRGAREAAISCAGVGPPQPRWPRTAACAPQGALGAPLAGARSAKHHRSLARRARTLAGRAPQLAARARDRTTAGDCGGSRRAIRRHGLSARARHGHGRADGSRHVDCAERAEREGGARREDRGSNGDFAGAAG